MKWKWTERFKILGRPLLVLAIVFTAEALIMLGLPLVMDPIGDPRTAAFIDALLLTLLVAPLLWILFRRQIRGVAGTITHRLSRRLGTNPKAASVAEVVQAIDGHRLLESDDMATLRSAASQASPSGAAELGERLVKEGNLTRYQVTKILEGHGSSLDLGDYVVVDHLGTGGMGEVFQARHRHMKRLVAVKVLPKSVVNEKQAVERFEREVEAAARLRHPNVVLSHDAGRAPDGRRFLVMEYVAGANLAAIVASRGPLPTSSAVECVRQAAKGLAYAHQNGIVHRDVKPANLLLDHSGTVKVLDLGLARFEEAPGIRAGLTQTGQVMGTVDYMSPEQAVDIRQARPPADIYSLGCTLYFLLTGREVYEGESVVQKLLAHQQMPAPHLPQRWSDVTDDLDGVFQKMIAKRPEDRFGTMQAVVDALETWQESHRSGVDAPALAGLIEGKQLAGNVESRSAAANAGVDERHVRPNTAAPHQSGIESAHVPPTEEMR